MGRHVHVLRRLGTPIDIFMDKKYIAVRSGLEFSNLTLFYQNLFFYIMHSGSFKYGNYKQQIKRERLKLNAE